MHTQSEMTNTRASANSVNNSRRSTRRLRNTLSSLTSQKKIQNN